MCTSLLLLLLLLLYKCTRSLCLLVCIVQSEHRPCTNVCDWAVVYHVCVLMCGKSQHQSLTLAKPKLTRQIHTLNRIHTHTYTHARLAIPSIYEAVSFAHISKSFPKRVVISMYCHSKAIELCVSALASMRMSVGVSSSFRRFEFAALQLSK